MNEYSFHALNDALSRLGERIWTPAFWIVFAFIGSLTALKLWWDARRHRRQREQVQFQLVEAMIHDDDVYTLIFTSDLALEVRSEFVDRTSVGLSVRDASAHVLGRYVDVLRDPNDGPVIIIALAALQLDHQTLMTSVQGAAIELIESREAERAWRSSDTATMQERRQLLSALAERLRTSPTVDDD